MGNKNLPYIYSFALQPYHFYSNVDDETMCPTKTHQNKFNIYKQHFLKQFFKLCYFSECRKVNSFQYKAGNSFCVTKDINLVGLERREYVRCDMKLFYTMILIVDKRLLIFQKIRINRERERERERETERESEKRDRERVRKERQRERQKREIERKRERERETQKKRERKDWEWMEMAIAKASS